MIFTDHMIQAVLTSTRIEELIRECQQERPEYIAKGSL